MFRNRAESLSRLMADSHLLGHSRLLDQVVGLTFKIADPTRIDRNTIEEVIVIARTLGSTGCPLLLVAPDEILDISQIFCNVTELTTYPSPDAATGILGDLLAKLEDKDSSVWKDPVWTARVAAVLAYFSALK